MNLSLREISQTLNGTLLGDPSLPISGITNSENPLKGHITFAQDPATVKKLEATEISCLIVSPKITASSKPLIQVANPKLAWAKLLRQFFPERSFSGTVSDLAYISPSAVLGKNVTIEPFASIGDRCRIGDGSVIRSHVFLDSDVQIGNKTILHAGCCLYERTVVGSGSVLHAGCIIGADGFGYVTTPAGQEKVPQVGNVIIEDHVELGACVTIDRATIGSTCIGEGTKIDNLVQIGHNVIIGKHTVISAQTGISGSSKVGSFVTMGGKAGLGDHVEIGDRTMVGAGSGFPSGKRIPGGQIVFGQPARPYAEARRQIAAQLRSAEMYEELRDLRRRVRELEEKLQNPSQA